MKGAFRNGGVPEERTLTATPAADPSLPFTFECSFDQRDYVYDGERWYEERTYQTPPRAVLQRLDERLRAQPEYEQHRVRCTTVRWAALMLARGLDASSEPAPESLRRSAPQARKTRCPRCNEGLSNRVDLQCPTCRWILCECGVCGCVSGRA
jgi:hypothetical protein